jgi:DNA replication protein DnaC
LANLPPDHPQAGRLLPCACTRQRQAAQIQQALPAKYRRMTFASFEQTDTNRAIWLHAHAFADNPWSEKYFLTLIGPLQRGKTHLALAIANALLERGEPVLIENVPSLLDDLRAGYADDSFTTRFERVLRASVLVLDDLGAESSGGRSEAYATTWAQDKLYQIIDQRVVNEQPTIVTSNLLRKLLTPRLAERLWNDRYASVRAIEAGSLAHATAR